MGHSEQMIEQGGSNESRAAQAVPLRHDKLPLPARAGEKSENIFPNAVQLKSPREQPLRLSITGYYHGGLNE